MPNNEELRTREAFAEAIWDGLAARMGGNYKDAPDDLPTKVYCRQVADTAISRIRASTPTLCEDEGCPHHGTAHVCISTSAQSVLAQSIAMPGCGAPFCRHVMAPHPNCPKCAEEATYAASPSVQTLQGKSSMANENKKTGYELLIAFEDQSESFVNGFEAGDIWQRMKAKASKIVEPIHTANVDLISQMAARNGFAVEFKPTEFEEWTYLDARPSQPTENKT